MMSNYEIVMGLEVHVELATKSKLFCSCSAAFGADPNENICPACMGMPGMPAILNKHAVELGITAGLVTNSEISPVITFDKKNYFYPDLPTGYQITQFFSPICKNGWIDIETKAENNTPPSSTRITIKQIHLEEDAGKLVHDARAETTLIDYNRTSVPLIEIVSNPDFRTSDEVTAYLEKLRLLLTFADISDCKMQEGSMRCDINISVRKKGETKLGTRTEIKNMNSLKAITRAIEYESQRHIDALETGTEKLIQETRRWDDELGETFSMREKEEAEDYRYFPNPEILPIFIDSMWIAEISGKMSEPSHEKYDRMVNTLGLPEYDSKIISSNRRLSQIFDEALKHFNKPKEISNWILGETLAISKELDIKDDDISIEPKKLAIIAKLVDEGKINRTVGKKVLYEVFKINADPEVYIETNSLAMVSDTKLLEAVIQEVLSENEKSVNEYRSGSEKVLGFLVGQVMKKTAGKADARLVNKLLHNLLIINK
ncbi:MAG: Asp-tRNA(Asn)/Glu-tRNA(Gln) amidotransferase subunit GatB [Oscillospiraceae bacterium]|jgi:aspartyl-tRNA(Asn)/glutamyl-tRNA(Gln) amidotransferase subunit B|nr:Asp-tRNA(Asn)/Glu-tRNA(Gln) amidotransferase subunit GatB [Oscillospiraceae bacterium]